MHSNHRTSRHTTGTLTITRSRYCPGFIAFSLVVAALSCNRLPTVGPRRPPPGLCASVLPAVACGVRGFTPQIEGETTVLVGASGLAMAGGWLYTVLEAKGVGGGIEQATDLDKQPFHAMVHGVLFRASAADPSSWQAMTLRLSHSCEALITTLGGDHHRRDLELESIDVRRDKDGTLRIAVGSDFGYVATGSIEGTIATLTHCSTSIRELPNNKAFEAVTLAKAATLGVMAFEEKSFKMKVTQQPGPTIGAPTKKRRYRRQRLCRGVAPSIRGGARSHHGAETTKMAVGQAMAMAPVGPAVLGTPARPRGCKKVPRIAGSARVGEGTVLIMSCKRRGGGYLYFLGAVAPGYGDVIITPLANDRFGKMTPNLEGLASAGGCDTPLWLIADDHNSAGAPTVLATVPLPAAFRARLSCVKRGIKRGVKPR